MCFFFILKSCWVHYLKTKLIGNILSHLSPYKRNTFVHRSLLWYYAIFNSFLECIITVIKGLNIRALLHTSCYSSNNYMYIYSTLTAHHQFFDNNWFFILYLQHIFTYMSALHYLKWWWRRCKSTHFYIFCWSFYLWYILTGKLLIWRVCKVFSQEKFLLFGVL